MTAVFTLQFEPGKRRVEMSENELLPHVSSVVDSVCSQWPRLTPSCEPHIVDRLRKRVADEIGRCSVFADFDFNHNVVSVTVKVLRDGFALSKTGIEVRYKWSQ